MPNERFHEVHDGRTTSPDHVELADTIVIERQSFPAGRNDEQEFEVVGIVEDSDSLTRYAVCYCRPADEFIVTDDAGMLLSDESLAQEILEDFLEQAGDSTGEESP